MYEKEMGWIIALGVVGGMIGSSFTLTIIAPFMDNITMVIMTIIAIGLVFLSMIPMYIFMKLYNKFKRKVYKEWKKLKKKS